MEKTEGIVNSWDIVAKVIAIVTVAQCFVSRLFLLIVLRCKDFYLVVKIMTQFGFGDTTNIMVTRLHGDVFEIIQVAEYAYFAELRDACEHHKT